MQLKFPRSPTGLLTFSPSLDRLEAQSKFNGLDSLRQVKTVQSACERPTLHWQQQIQIKNSPC